MKPTLFTLPFPFAPAAARYGLSFLAGLVGFGYLMVAGGYLWRGDYTVQLVGLFLGFGAALAWAVKCVLQKKIALPRTPIDAAVLIGLLVILASLAASPDPRQGLARSASLLGYALAFYLFLTAFSAGLNRRAMLTALLTISGVILAEAVLETALWYRQWFETAGGFHLPPTQYRFHGLLMPGPTLGLANLLVGLALAAFLRERSPMVRALAAVWLVCYGLAFPFSSSRGGWLGLAAGLLMAGVVWIVEKRPWTRVKTWPAPRLILLSAAGLLVLAVTFSLGIRFLITFASQESHAGDPFGLTGRDAIWGGALHIWQNSPLVGAGPGRFALDYLRVTPGTPPGFWPVHAHSIFFQALAEFGLAGLAAWLWLLVCLVRWLLDVYRRASDTARPALMAVYAGLVALLVQLVFDEFSGWWSVMLPAIFVIAWSVTQPSKREKDRPETARNIPAAWLGLPVALLLGWIGYSLWSYQPLAAAMAQTTDVHTLATAADESARRDPAFHFYQSQAGLLHAWDWQASSDRAALDEARAYLARAIRLEPSSSWLIADLGVLDDAAGQTELSLSRLRRAAEISPRVAAYPLALGRILEKSGDSPGARAAFLRAIALDASLVQLPFWQTTPLRQAVRAEVPPVAPPKAGQEPRAAAAAWVFDDTVDYTYAEFIAERSPLGYSAAPGLMP